MSIGSFTFGWFDLGVLALIGIGMYRGRTRGMSEELLDVVKWLAIVVAGGLVYRPVGHFVAGYTHFPIGVSYVMVYLLVIIVIRLLFSWIKHGAGEKLVGSDAFGNSEYYLGMLAGGVRFACYLLVGLALLHARNVSPEQLAAQARTQQDNFGDISFPTLGTIQHTVFAGSASGQFAKRYLSGQLIVPNASDRAMAHRDTIGRQRERAIYEVLGEKK